MINRSTHHWPLSLHLFQQQIVQFHWNQRSGPKLRFHICILVEEAVSTRRHNTSIPGSTDVSYYINVLAKRGLFTSDQTLMTNTATANQVNQSKRNPLLWRSKFAAAMVKMGQLDVLTGNAGEIRSNCRVINS